MWRQRAPVGWRGDAGRGAADAAGLRAAAAARTCAAAGAKLAAQLLIFVLTALLLRHGRATATAWPQRDALLEQFVAITEHPWSAALLASLMTMLWIERDAPRIVWVIAGWLAIPAALRVVTRIIDPQRYFLAYVLTIYAARRAAARRVLGQRAAACKPS